MRTTAALLAFASALGLAACGTTVVGDDTGLAWARLGERVYVGGPAVTPLEVLEDSRCPSDVACAWAGQVRLRATIHLGSGDVERELTTGMPVPIADGSLELARVRPAVNSKKAIVPDDYRLGFRFEGGL